MEQFVQFIVETRSTPGETLPRVISLLSPRVNLIRANVNENGTSLEYPFNLRRGLTHHRPTPEKGNRFRREPTLIKSEVQYTVYLYSRKVDT